MEIKNVLKNYRAENKISQREFARRSGLFNSLISILEMGVNPQTGKKITPDLNTYKKLADAMGMTVHQLFEIIGDSEYVSLKEMPTFREELAEDLDDVTKKLRIPPTGTNVPDNALFVKAMGVMSPEDLTFVMDAFARAFKTLKDNGELK